MSEVETDNASLPRQPGIEDLKLNHYPTGSFDSDGNASAAKGAGSGADCGIEENGCPEREFILN